MKPNLQTRNQGISEPNVDLALSSGKNQFLRNMKNRTIGSKNLSNFDQFDFELDDSDDADISDGNNSQDDSLNNLAMLSSFGA